MGLLSPCCSTKWRKRRIVSSATIVEATVIEAPSSTKNADATRDPEMKQTRKGRNWYFGMKLHSGQINAASSTRSQS
jgi:hypothetical protein